MKELPCNNSIAWIGQAIELLPGRATSDFSYLAYIFGNYVSEIQCITKISNTLDY